MDLTQQDLVAPSPMAPSGHGRTRQPWQHRGVDSSIPAYQHLLAKARADTNVEGVVLVGSRALDAFVTSHSDFDVFVVLARQGAAWQRSQRGGALDVVPVSVEELERHALPGSGSEWNRPAFVDARVDFDRHGLVAPIIDRKRRLTDEEAQQIAADALDDYINALYRSLKNHRDGRDLAGHLDAAESIGPLLTTLFALERRVRPWNKYLRLEVDRLALPVPNLLERVQIVLGSGDPETQRSLWREVETVARDRGFGELIDSWQPDVTLLRGDGAAGSVATPTTGTA